MALNQTIFSPLTNYSGSISAFTSDDYTTLEIISSSLPAYQRTGWEYKIMTTPSSSNDTAQTAVDDLRLNLLNSRKYIVEGYLSGATSATANGLRVGIVTTAAETHYVIENPTSTTAIGYSFSVTNAAGSGPGNSIQNYFLIYIKGIIITAGAGSPTWAPTISSEGAGGGSVALGPSIIYYRQY
jgi:hypothetical protein